MNNFENTYRENYPKMFCVARKIVNDEDVASDIVQEVFVYYFEKLQNGIAVHYPSSWLIRASMNKCVDYLNQKKKHMPLSVVNEWEAEEEQSDSTLQQAISELKPAEMKLIMLYSEGYSYKEIAQIAEINLSSVGKTLSRALQKLKEILKRLNYEMY